MSQATQNLTMQYLIVDDAGHEEQFEAIGDSQAIELSKKKYADWNWKLYRIQGGGRVNVCDKPAECKGA